MKDRPLCETCSFNELRRFLMAGKPAEDRGCCKHIHGFPAMTDCRDYRREPGTDDE